MKTPLIIDCDPGTDDAVALFLAFASPDLDILGITTVAGNVGPELTARNACILRQMAGREDVPVFAGCDRPLVRQAVEAGEFHGDSGLGDLEVFEPAESFEAEHAVEALIRLIMERPAKAVTLAVTGPMTNLALALRREPRLAARLGPVVVMGGARSEGGNITPSAEFNIYADPHAADIVFRAGLETVVLGLDATHQVRCTEARSAAVRAVDTPMARATAGLIDFSNRVEREIVGSAAAPMHDPCVIAWILDPALFQTAPCEIRVETASDLTMGHTAVEFRVEAATATCRWATAADADGVFALIAATLKAAA